MCELSNGLYNRKWILRIEANSNYGKFNNRQKQLGQRDETKLHKQGEERTQGGLQHAR